MSVVNRMLQDIDRRMGAAGAGHHPHPDVRSVPAGGRARRARWPVALALGLAAAVAALGLAGGSRQERAAQATAPAAVRVAAAPAQQPPASPAGSEPKPTTPATESKPKPAAAPAGSEPKPMASPAVAAVMVREEEPRAPRRPRPSPVPAPHRTFQLSVRLSDPPAQSPGAPAAPAPPKIEPAAAKPAQVRRSEVPVRRVAADETVAAALALWSEGARGDALATLRDALAIAEPRNPQVAGRLGRELARLEVAGERPEAALAVLRRLEGLLAGDADAWALRGNAAQRLSLHPEAASAYLAAVRLRPDEGKWMLGAAISLAADGRLDEARPWVERARERGAVTAPIAAYLQQLGLGPRQ
jgi:hypothetical protein